MIDILIPRFLLFLHITYLKVIQSSFKKYLTKKTNKLSLPDFILISKPGSWNRTSVRAILLNPFYSGVRVWNRFDNRLNQVRDSSEWIFVENSHDRIIDDQTFIAVSNKYQEIKRK